MNNKSDAKAENEEEGDRECFAIMPISDPEEYEAGHFARVYESLIEPACKKAEFRASRADRTSHTNLIHLDILRRLLNAPMALCDLSSRNPNVLFELGIRQAFDKPVVLIQEEGTKPIFDIAGLRILNYSRTLRYDEVLKSQAGIAKALQETYDKKDDPNNVNSIVRLLGLGAANFQALKGDPSTMQLNLLLSEVQAMRRAFESAENRLKKPGMISQYAARRGGPGAFSTSAEKANTNVARLNALLRILDNLQVGVTSGKVSATEAKAESTFLAREIEAVRRGDLSSGESEMIVHIHAKLADLLLQIAELD